MKRILTIALCVAIAATGCKKKEEPKKNNNSGTTTGGTTTGGTTTGGTTTGGSTTGGPGTPTNATTFSGAFTTVEGEMSSMGFSVSLKSASAWFSSVPTATVTGNGIEVESVHLNNVELEYDSVQGIYVSSGAVAFATETWSVTGNASIPSFVQSNPQSRPTTVKVSSLPTTITKANGVTINLGNLSNFKVGTIFISDGTGNAGGIIIDQLVPGENSITLSSSQLNGFQPGQQTGSIMIMLENGHSLHINGKNFYFSQQVSAMTSISIN